MAMPEGWKYSDNQKIALKAINEGALVEFTGDQIEKAREEMALEMDAGKAEQKITGYLKGADAQQFEAVDDYIAFIRRDAESIKTGLNFGTIYSGVKIIAKSIFNRGYAGEIKRLHDDVVGVNLRALRRGNLNAYESCSRLSQRMTKLKEEELTKRNQQPQPPQQ